MGGNYFTAAVILILGTLGLAYFTQSAVTALSGRNAPPIPARAFQYFGP